MKKILCVIILLSSAVCADSLDSQRAAIHARRNRLKTTVQQSLEKITQAYIRELEKIGEEANKTGLNGLAAEIRSEIETEQKNSGLYTSEGKHSPLFSPGNPAEEKLRKKIERARQNMARKKIRLADSCFKAGLIGTAYDLALTTFTAYPDQKDLRKLFGYYKAGDGWMRKYEYEQYKKGFKWNDRLGWIYRKVEDEYTDSNYFDGKEFIPLSEAQSRHSSWKSPWVIETEHFIVKSNMKLAQVTSLATKLESFHRQFFRYYVGYFSFDSGGAMETLFRMEKAKKLTVHYWKNKNDFAAHARSIGSASMAGYAGFYSPRTGTSQFYHMKGITYSVLFHEVTHQILGEYGTGNPSRSAYWIVEGAAVASESTKVSGELSVTFDPMKNSRIHSVRKSWGRRSMQQFMNITYEAFQKQDMLMNYAVAGTLTTFFLEYDHGRYRDDFTDYLRDIYFGKINGEKIKIHRYLGKDFSELDEEFRTWLTSKGQG